jgi:hypothetical protein
LSVELLILAPIRRTRSPCCARKRPTHRRAAEQRDERTPFQLTELHAATQPGESATA